MKNQSEKFAQALITLCPCGKLLANLVLAIASYTGAKSVVEYSESPLYHYQYSSIGKLFAQRLESVGGDPALFATQVECFLRAYRPDSTVMRTQLDTTNGKSASINERSNSKSCSNPFFNV